MVNANSALKLTLEMKGCGMGKRGLVEKGYGCCKGCLDIWLESSVVLCNWTCHLTIRRFSIICCNCRMWKWTFNWASYAVTCSGRHKALPNWGLPFFSCWQSLIASSTAQAYLTEAIFMFISKLSQIRSCVITNVHSWACLRTEIVSGASAAELSALSIVRALCDTRWREPF